MKLRESPAQRMWFDSSAFSVAIDPIMREDFAKCKLSVPFEATEGTPQKAVQARRFPARAFGGAAPGPRGVKRQEPGPVHPTRQTRARLHKQCKARPRHLEGYSSPCS